VINKFCLLPVDQRLQAARAHMDLFKVILSSDDDEESLSIKAVDWGRKISDDIESNMTKLNAIRRKVDESTEHKVGEETSEHAEAALTSSQLNSCWVEPLQKALKAVTDDDSDHLKRELGWKIAKEQAFLPAVLSVLKGQVSKEVVSRSDLKHEEEREETETSISRIMTVSYPTTRYWPTLNLETCLRKLMFRGFMKRSFTTTQPPWLKSGVDCGERSFVVASEMLFNASRDNTLTSPRTSIRACGPMD